MIISGNKLLIFEIIEEQNQQYRLECMQCKQVGSLIRTAQILQHREGEPIILVTDATDGLTKFKATGKYRRKNETKKMVLKLKVVAQTQYREATDLMTTICTKNDELICFDSKGYIQIYKANTAKGGIQLFEKIQTTISLVRRFVEIEGVMIGFDITG